MQVSVENTSTIQRRLTIGVPCDQVDGEVEKRLKKNAKSIRINGFRPGKVPVSVVRKRFGEGIRQDVVGEVMRESYMEAIQSENLKPAGFPEFETKQSEAGKDIEFVATFEVFPEISVTDLAGISVTQQETEVTESDIETMIESLRKQSVVWIEKQGEIASGDRVTIDFEGKIDGEVFEGGSGEGSVVEVGSGSMIPGFEDGLIGLKAGDEKDLALTFPEDYNAKDLQGKAVHFHVAVSKTEQGKMPELDEAFFAKYGVAEGGLEAFHAELKKNMEREAGFAIANKVKKQIVDQLIAGNTFEVPKALVKQEVGKIKQEAAQRFGIPEDETGQLPDELFSGQAETRVKSGLLFAQLVKDNELVASEEKISTKISELAASYQDPSEVRNWYMNNPEHKQQIESLVLEEVVVDHILTAANVEKVAVGYAEAVKPETAKPEASLPAGDADSS